MVTKLRNRKLPERSYLLFRFARKDRRAAEFFLPFLENIDVSESQRSNLVTYDLIGRAGNLFSYAGAKSREFQIRFNLTLPNVEDYLSNIGLPSRFTGHFRHYDINKPLDKERFKSKESVKIKDTNKASADSNFIDFYEESRKRFYEKYSPIKEVANTTLFDSAINFVLNDVLQVKQPPPKKSIKDAVNLLVLWIGLVRSSTLNDSNNTSFGPPTIYLNHGSLYRNIPCVCSNFSIKINNQFGFDLISMSPRQIEVTMNLIENRTGDFKEYHPFEYIQGENLAGWEAIIKYGTTDPYNDFWNDENSFEVKELNKTLTNNIGLI